MPTTILDTIPRSLRGRGGKAVLPVRCDSCTETFLWPKAKGRMVACPTCRELHELAVDDDAFALLTAMDGSKQ
jgi:phage FluMu protein Com